MYIAWFITPSENFQLGFDTSSYFILHHLRLILVILLHHQDPNNWVTMADALLSFLSLYSNYQKAVVLTLSWLVSKKYL